METSIFIAQIIGLAYLSLGIGLLFNKDYYKDVFDKLINDSSFMMLGGMFSLIIGMLILHTHSVYTSDWRIVITLFGWAATVK